MTEPVTSRHTLRNAGLGLLAVLLLSLGLWATVPEDDASPPGSDARPAKTSGLPVVQGLGGDFRLASTAGGELDTASLRGKVVLLNFGFTSCPDVCPMTLTRLSRALKTLADDGRDMTRVQPLFVTFDPERDSLAHLAEYVRYFHPALLGLRGTPEQTAEIGRRYRVLYQKQDTGSEGGYVFQHTDYIYVIDTQGRVRLLVGGKDPDEAIIEAVKALLREADAR